MLKWVLPCIAVLQLSACAGGVDLSKTQVDRSLLTNAVEPQPDAPDKVRLSDANTIRNAVSSADPDAARSYGIPWANADTGSRGAITGLVEYRKNGLLCRRFKASRESFDGVALFDGDTCRFGDGSWQMLAFDQS